LPWSPWTGTGGRHQSELVVAINRIHRSPCPGARILVGVDIDPNRCHWSLFSLRLPQFVSLRDELRRALNVSIQCPHDADARHHGRPVEINDEHQREHRCLPLRRQVLSLRSRFIGSEARSGCDDRRLQKLDRKSGTSRCHECKARRRDWGSRAGEGAAPSSISERCENSHKARMTPSVSASTARRSQVQLSQKWIEP
jgi:hypothetical protein